MGRNTHFCTVPGSPSLTDTLVMCLGNSDVTVRSLRKPLVLENHHTPSQRLPVFGYFLHLLKRRGDPYQCWAQDSCAHTPSKAHPVSSAKSRASQSVVLGPAASTSPGDKLEREILWLWPNLVNQKFWGWDPAIRVEINPPGNPMRTNIWQPLLDCHLCSMSFLISPLSSAPFG